MERNRIYEIAELVRRNRGVSNQDPIEEIETADGAANLEPDGIIDISVPDIEPIMDEPQEPDDERECGCLQCNHKLINAAIDNAHKLNLNGKNSSVLLTLIRLLKMNPDELESQKTIADSTNQAVSTIERHVRYLRENGFIETELITDENGSKTVYKVDNLINKLRDIGVEI